MFTYPQFLSYCKQYIETVKTQTEFSNDEKLALIFLSDTGDCRRMANGFAATGIVDDCYHSLYMALFMKFVDKVKSENPKNGEPTENTNPFIVQHPEPTAAVKLASNEKIDEREISISSDEDNFVDANETMRAKPENPNEDDSMEASPDVQVILESENNQSADSDIEMNDDDDNNDDVDLVDYEDVEREELMNTEVDESESPEDERSHLAETGTNENYGDDEEEEEDSSSDADNVVTEAENEEHDVEPITEVVAPAELNRETHTKEQLKKENDDGDEDNEEDDDEDENADEEEDENDDEEEDEDENEDVKIIDEDDDDDSVENDPAVSDGASDSDSSNDNEETEGPLNHKSDQSSDENITDATKDKNPDEIIKSSSHSPVILIEERSIPDESDTENKSEDGSDVGTSSGNKNDEVEPDIVKGLSSPEHDNNNSIASDTAQRSPKSSRARSRSRSLSSGYRKRLKGNSSSSHRRTRSYAKNKNVVEVESDADDED
ncbi:unnamed protein product [Ambrosiozyma monospora]|uniref:Unnamed protein product n=1 Tax=Ambrosiozyma monospora TaxID=43982 RepID=A0A9W6Z1R4_AMBMO|nr:unnamed protein product [Ambrosiozyma monospora]